MRRPHERARRLARDVHRECGIDEPSKIDPFVIAGRRGIAMKYGKLEGATARIFHLDGRAVIRVSDSIVQEGRLRFSIAHEMGHVLLGHRIPAEAELDASRTWYSTHQEREADAFAAEHNMPEAWVGPYCSATPINLESVRTIARVFRSSVVASAVRFVELCHKACAVVYSERGRVVWAKRSRRFAPRIPSQMKVGVGTVAFDYHESGIIDPNPRMSSARAWYGATVLDASGVNVIEHAEVVPEPGWGGVLSLLSLASLDGEQRALHPSPPDNSRGARPFLVGAEGFHGRAAL